MADEESTSQTAIRRERFSGGPARGFLSSMDADDRIFSADLAVDRAHVVMLAEQGIVDGDDAAAILEALDDIEGDGFDALPDGEDVHEAIETAVIERVGPDGGKMHTARSRNDEVATCIRYRLREDVLATVERTLEFREVLADGADQAAETVMPGVTHLQPAQPTTVGHYLLSYERALARDTARLLDAYGRVNQSPLGGAAFAGTPFDVDRERTAALLGFEGVVENATDAASARDFLVEVTSALAGLSLTLSGIAEDLVIFANKGYVELADDYSSTSSIMPQKKNPDTLELVRSTTGDATAGLQGLLTTLKGLPRAYNRDLQNATPHAWSAIDAVTEAVEVAAGAVATAEWPAETLEAAAGEGFSCATGVADVLAMHGVPFRTAHEVVADAGQAGGDLAAVEAACERVLGESLDVVADRDAVAAALDPVSNVAMRDSRGGPAPEAVAATLDVVTAELATDRNALESVHGHLDAAAGSLQSEVADYV